MVKHMIVEQQIEILENLTYIATQNRSINLVTNFRGMPINLSGHIIRVSHVTGTVRVCSHQRQMMPIRKTDQLFLQSELFPLMVVAEIGDFNLRNQIITLKDLRYVNGSVGNRKNVRVQPETPLLTEITTNQGYKIQGNMIDISMIGVSIELDVTNSLINEVLPSQSQVDIQFVLPIQGQLENLIIPARVANLRADKILGIFRVGLLTLLNDQNQQIVRRYVFDRQTRIFNTIRKINNDMLGVLI